jgi:uncharacterized protein
MFPVILLATALWQTTPSGGAIAKFVPPVPTPASFISDQRSVLSPEAKRMLDGRIKALQAAGFGDVAVAILPSIGSYAPQQVGVEIYRTWKVGSVAAIGSARRDVGELILIVPKELAPDGKGQCFIVTGMGSEGIITDAAAGAICRDSIIPHLRNKDYASAVAAGIGGLEARLRRDQGLASSSPGRESRSAVDQSSTRNPRSGIPPAVPIGIAIVLTLIAGTLGGRRYFRNKPRICKRCGSQMRRLDETADDAKLDGGQRLEEKLHSVDYDVWVCDCGESQAIPYRKWFSKYSDCRKCGRRTASSNYYVVVPATTIAPGLAEKSFECQACNATWVDQIILPRITQSSSSSGSGGGGGGGGGGGHSFGGSGATSGGGGGSSY